LLQQVERELNRQQAQARSQQRRDANERHEQLQLQAQLARGSNFKVDKPVVKPGGTIWYVNNLEAVLFLTSLLMNCRWRCAAVHHSVVGVAQRCIALSLALRSRV
jgi:hypothetical protein